MGMDFFRVRQKIKLSIGIPHEISIEAVNTDPANTNVYSCTAFRGLGATVVECAIQLRAGTAGIQLKIWQNSGGTVRGIGTNPDGILLGTQASGSSVYGHYKIKLDANGDFFWQVSNSNVDILRIEGFLAYKNSF